MTSIRAAAVTVTLLLSATTLALAATDALRDGLTVVYRSPAAPRLRLQSLGARQYDLSQMKGRVVVVNFWATWCPPCIEELPTIQHLWDDTHGSGLEVLAVNVGESAETIETFLRGLTPKLAFPILLDSDGEAFRTWGVRGLPKTYIVDKRGHIIYEAEGGRDMSSRHIRERLQALLDE